MVALFSPPAWWLTQVTTKSEEGIPNGLPKQRSANGGEDADEGHFHETPARWTCGRFCHVQRGKSPGFSRQSVQRAGPQSIVRKSTPARVLGAWLATWRGRRG